MSLTLIGELKTCLQNVINAQFQGPGCRGHHPAPGQAQADRGGQGEAQDKDIIKL